VLHFSPGPAFPPFVTYPKNATPSYNTFIATSWDGPVKVPATADGVRQAAADVLVQTLVRQLQLRHHFGSLITHFHLFRLFPKRHTTAYAPYGAPCFALWRVEC